MSTNFGTTSLPTVFKPTGATPIDVRTYFESYASALEAARIAAVAGDSNVIYYFGQLLTVYEPTTGAATIYKIVKAPEGTTYTDSEGNEKTATGALEAIDTTFEVGDIPIATASSVGAVKVAATSDIALAEDGAIDLNATVKAEIAKIAGKQDNLVIADGYDSASNPVATKKTVTDAVSAITGFEYSVVTELPPTGVKGTIYLVASKSEEGKDEYLEYVWVEVDGVGSFERLGRTIDMEAELAGYATEQWVSQSYQTISQATTDKQTLEAKDNELDGAIKKVADDLSTLSVKVDGCATQTQVNEINTTVTSHGTRLDAVEQLAGTTSSNLATTKSDLEAKDDELAGDIEKITTETIPAVQQSVTDLGTRVTNVETTADSNLASAKSELEGKIATAQSAAEDAAKAASDEASRAKGVEEDLQSQITAVKGTADAAAKQTDLTALSGTVSGHTTKLGEIEGDINTISGDLANVGSTASGAASAAKAAQDTADANKPVAGLGIVVEPIAENGGQTIKIDSTEVVTLSDTQTISGAKTFTSSIILPPSNEGALNAITRDEAVDIATTKANAVKVSGSEYIDVAEGTNVISVKSTVATTDKAQTFADTVTFSQTIVGDISGKAAGLDGLEVAVSDLNKINTIEQTANGKQDPISVTEGLTFDSETSVVSIDNNVVPMLDGSEVKVSSTVLASTTDVDNKIAAKISNAASDSADWTSTEKVPTLKAVADKITATHAGVMTYKGVITVNAESTAETVAADIAAKAPIKAADFFIISASGDVNVTVDGSALSSNDLIIASEAMETVDLTKFQLVGINDATVVNTTSEQEIEGLKKFATGVQVLVDGTYESVVTTSALNSAIDGIPTADESTIKVVNDKLTVADADKIVKATSIVGDTITLTNKDIVVDTPAESETNLVANVAYVNAKVGSVTPVAGTGITIGTDKSIGVDATVLTTTSSHINSSNGPIAGNLDFTGTLQKRPTAEGTDDSKYSIIATIDDINALIALAAPTKKKTYVSGTNGDFAAQTNEKTSIWEIIPAADDKTLDTADVTCTVRDKNGELVHPEIKFGEKKLTIIANTAALEGILPLSVTVVA